MPKDPFKLIDDISNRIEKGFGTLERLGDGIEKVFTKIEGRTPTTAPESQKEVPILTKPSSTLSTEDTVAYHKRKIGKQLLALESHYAERMRIMGVPCDCGSTKHLLFIEQLSEETIPMVDNASIYEELINWVRENEPKSTHAAAKSGKYDDEYLALSGQARGFRKRLLGSTARSALIESEEQVTLEK